MLKQQQQQQKTLVCNSHAYDGLTVFSVMGVHDDGDGYTCITISCRRLIDSAEGLLVEGEYVTGHCHRYIRSTVSVGAAAGDE